jgi:hypothetical protein
VQAGEVAANTPWFETYKAEFFRTLLFNDHETFDHPLACGCLSAVVIARLQATGTCTDAHNPQDAQV